MEKVMKRVKIGIWVLIVVFAFMLIYQNQQFFLAGQSLRLNLLFAEYQSPEWKIVMICTGFFAAGLILGIYILIAYQLRMKKKRKAQRVQPEKPVKADERIAAPEPAPKPAPAMPRGSNSETVIISPEVTSPVAEQQEQ